MQLGRARLMLKRFLRAMEYRSYCMAIRELRAHGYYKKAEEITEFKNQNYGSW